MAYLPTALSVLLAVLLAILTLRRVLLIAGALLPPRPTPTSGRTLSIAILIAARDEEQNLPYLLAALDQLDYPAERLSFHLVSDGSTDRTAALMEAWASGRANATVRLLPDSRGKSAALRIAHEDAGSADVLLTVDADTQPHPGSVRELAAAFSDPRVGAAGGQVRITNPRQNLISRYASLEFWMHFLVNLAGKDRWNLGPIPSGSAAAYRREAIEKIGGFREDLADDAPTSVRLLAEGFSTRLIAAARVDTCVVTTLGDWIKQRERWAAALKSAAISARGPETWLVVAGYADRIVLAIAAIATALGGLSIVFPLAYAAVLAGSAVVAIVRAGYAARLHEFLGVTLLMAPVELWISISGLAKKVVPAWRPPGRDAVSRIG